MGNLWKAWLSGLGLSVVAASSTAMAAPPGIYYSWRAMDMTMAQCLNRSGQALEGQNLGDIQVDATSVAGRSEDVTAVFICLQNQDSTTVMVIVASEDDEKAVQVREALKTSF